MTRLPDKSTVLDALRTRVARDLAAAEWRIAQARALEHASHDGEPVYRALAMTRHADNLRNVGVALWAAELEQTFGDEDPIALGALVAVEDAGQVAAYLIAPLGGGLRVTVEDVEVCVVTLDSPIATALLDRHVGDTLHLETPSGVRSLIVTALR